MTAPFRMARVGKHTLVYGVGILLGKAVSFVMLPLYTRYLTPADYGVMQLVDMTLEIVSIFAGTRIAGGVFKYYQQAETEARKRAVLSTAATLLMALLGAFGIATALAAPAVSRLVFGSPAQATLIALAAASMAVSSVTMVPFALMRLQERSVRYTWITTAKLVLQLTLNVVFLAVLRMGVKGIFISTLISNVALGLWLGVPFVVRVGVRFSRHSAYELLRYGLPLVATHSAAFITTFGDRYFLRVSGNLTAVGLYSLAYQFGFILLTLGNIPFAMMWEPMQFEVAARPDRDALYARAFLYFNLLLMTVALGIGLFVFDFIRVMADPSYRGATGMVPIILLAYILQSWSTFVETGALVRARTELITLATWLSAVAALLGYALLIPRWLGYGAAIATVLAFVVRLLVSQYFLQRLLPLRLQWGRVWRLTGVTAAVYLATLLVPLLPLAGSLAVRCALFGCYGLIVWFGIIPEDERESILARVPARLRLR